MLKAGWRPALLLFLTVILSSCFLHHPNTGWNVNTRLALVFAVVDGGTLSIDDYHDLPPYETMDKAVFEGRYYSDKIFGVSLLALPAYGALKAVCSLFGTEPGFQLANYALSRFAVTLPAAVSLVLLLELMLGLGASVRRSLVAVFGIFFGSMWWGYSLVFYPYAPGIACCLGAMLVLHRVEELTARSSALVGGLLGYAMLCDLTFGLVVVGIGCVYLWRLSGGTISVRGWLVNLGAGSLAGAAPLALFVAYSVAIFGSPTIPYEYEALDRFREGMQQGFMGVTGPKGGPLWFLTLHPYRGVLFWTPLLMAALVGGMIGLVNGDPLQRPWLLLAIGSFVAYLLFNAGYYMWWGGWAMGPRLMLPMFAAVPLGLLTWCRPGASRSVFVAMAALSALSFVLSAPLSIIDPQIPQGNPDSILDTAGLGTRLEVPQFVYWRAFASLAWLQDEGGVLQWPRLASYGGALATILAGLLASIRSARDPESESTQGPVS
jgi:hypothetical protein